VLSELSLSQVLLRGYPTPHIHEAILTQFQFIRKLLVGKTIARVTAQNDDLIYGKVGTSATEFEKHMVGKTIIDAGQQGKYFWMIMSSPPHPVMHFGMTGWLKFNAERKSLSWLVGRGAHFIVTLSEIVRFSWSVVCKNGGFKMGSVPSSFFIPICAICTTCVLGDIPCVPTGFNRPGTILMPKLPGLEQNARAALDPYN
jgi:hypothetical protein